MKKIKNIVSHLLYLPFPMLLRYNKILKIFAILLFIVELLVPALVIGETAYNSYFETTQSQLGTQTRPIDLITHLIFEETNSEEREGKDDILVSVCFTEVFNELQKFIPVQITWPLPKEQFDTEPSLFTLHRVLLI